MNTFPPKFSIKSTLSNGAQIGAPVAAVAGFLADIASPIFAFPRLFLGIAAVAFFALAFYWLRYKRKQIIAAYAADGAPEHEVRQHLAQSKWFKALCFSFAAVIISSAFNVAAAFTQDEDEGFFAATFDKFAELQKSLFDIKKDQKTIIGKLDDISAKFDDLPKGGLIAKPKSPQDYYHNAKVYELEANFSLARQAYGKYLEFNLAFLDPHLSYQKLLRVQDGAEGAREVYDFLSKSAPDNVAIQMARILLYDAAKRKTGLTAFTTAHPHFTPALYFLSLEYSEQKLGSQTITDKQLELKALTALMPAIETGSFLRHFLDKNAGLELAEEAKARYAKAKLTNTENPVNILYSVTANGATINILLTEAARELWYSIGEEAGEMTSSGPATWVDPRLGVAGANLALQTKSYAKDFKIWIKYQALNNDVVGPFAVTVSPLAEVVKHVKRILTYNPHWVVEFRRGAPKTINGSVVPMADKVGLTAIKYSFDKPTLDRSYPFVPVPITEVSRFSPDETNVLQIPETVKSVYMRLTFKDGTKSEVNVSPVKIKE